MEADGRQQKDWMTVFPSICWILCLFPLVFSLHSEEEKSNRTTLEELEAINGTQNFRIARKSKENKGWYDGQEHTSVHCVRKAKCEQMKVNTCLGSKLPYTHTSLHLTYSYSQDQVNEKLQQYMILKHIPKCWAVVQPFLCAIFKPKCESINEQDMVFLPSLEMCRNIMEPCKLVYNTSIFPQFLKCNSTLFPSDCANDVKETRFNTTGQCLPPLVHTDVVDHFYPGIRGCGLPCQDPMYTEDEHQQIRRLITWGLGVSLFFNVLATSTFIIDWRNASKYPAVSIFYINVCFIMSSLGWLVQFFADSRSDIVCSKDGTVRRGEPSAGENLSCVVVFVLVYYFLIAACVWFVIFTYAWHMSFKGLGKILDRIDKKGAYFHLVAWSLPLIFTITVMALGEIDGSSIVGICFVGYMNHAIRGGFLLGPIVLTLLIGGFFLIRGLITLISVRTSSKDIISVRASSKIKQSIMRCSVAGSLILLFVCLTVFCHSYEFRNSTEWQSSFQQLLVCRLISMHKGTEPTECVQSSRPSVALLQLQLLCLWGSAILMSSWVWTRATMHSWKRYIRRKCGHDDEEPVKLQKHKLIAQAFSRRKEFHNQGRMSISFHNTHTDPVGLNFELNSVASYDFSSTWANNLPRFVKRRGALTGAQHSHSHSSNAPRRNSQDSQISFSLRHVSVESRRNSLDSQLSVKIAEMKTKVASRRRVKTHGKSSRRRATRNNTSTIYTRKESTTSVESQIGTHILSALSSTKERQSNSMTRRTANAGLSKEQVDLLLANGKVILPFLQNQGLTTTSDEENGSMASFKIKDSQINFVLKQKEGNFSGNDTNIREYHSDSEQEDNNKQLILMKQLLNETPISSGELKVDMDVGYGRKDLRGSKSSGKSKSSRRSSRQSARTRHKHSVKGKTKETAIPMSVFKARNSDCKPENFVKNSLESSFDSYCSELGPLALQSSFSGVSLEKNNSRNSKRSCDVGIQANSHEIATQTLSSYETDKLKISKGTSIKKSQNSYSASDKPLTKSQKKEKNQCDKVDYNDLDNHMHHTTDKTNTKPRLKGSKCDESDEPLLNIKRNNIDKPIIVKKRNDASCNMSESKKLKQLLLP